MSTALSMFFGTLACITMEGATTRQPSDLIVLDFTAPWCQPCRETEQAMARLSEEGWLFRQINVDREKELVRRWNVTELPTLIVLEQGREIDRIVGKQSYETLKARLGQQASTASTDVRKSPVALPTTSAMPTPPPDPMRSTVRIRVEDGNSTSFGSGTIIDQHQEEALVLTCGHLFRDLSPQAIVTIDAMVEDRLQTWPATIVDYQCQEVDIGLIAFRPVRSVAVASLLPRGIPLREQDPVCSFGCDQGADPSRRDSVITKLNRYLGPANVEVAVAPVQGRSGGGLFNAQGQLIGVCYAADNELNEGLYSGPEVVYAQLQRLGLTRLYEKQAPVVAAAASAVAASTHASIPSVSAVSALTSNATRDPFPDRSMGDGWKQAIEQAAVKTQSLAAQANQPAPPQPSLTAILRDAEGREQRFTIPTPSVELLRAIQSQAMSPDFSSVATR